jgi:hypothetical protein
MRIDEAWHIGCTAGAPGGAMILRFGRSAALAVIVFTTMSRLGEAGVATETLKRIEESSYPADAWILRSAMVRSEDKCSKTLAPSAVFLCQVSTVVEILDQMSSRTHLQVWMIGVVVDTAGKHPIFGSQRSGVGLVMIEGRTRVVRVTSRQPLQFVDLGPFLD